MVSYTFYPLSSILYLLSSIFLGYSSQLQAMHQHIGVIKEPYHHKDLGNLGIVVLLAAQQNRSA